MSTPETPDAATGADAAPSVDEAERTDAAVTETADAADLTPPAPPAPAESAVRPPAYTGTQPPAWEPLPANPEQTTRPEAPGAGVATVPLTGPRIRWAGIVWGLVLASIAATALWLLTDPARQAALTSWLVDLSPATAIAFGVLVVGAFALIAGVVGIARRAQRGIERRRAASAP